MTLVYNPGGAPLPPAQDALEADYRRALGEQHGVVFDHLWCLANLPIGRFASFLRARNELASYQSLLVERFNPETVHGLMCRDTVSVSWSGAVFDCDFNQMLALPMGGRGPRLLEDLDPSTLAGRGVGTGSHCFGCTAGRGSGCDGALAPVLAAAVAAQEGPA